MDLPTPIGWSKTPLRPLREAFRVRMGGQVENAATFSDSRWLEGIRKGLRIRMGRYPAEIAEVYWEGGKGTSIGAVFNNCLGLLNRYH